MTRIKANLVTKKNGNKPKSFKDKIALVMMIKNEEKRIEVSFDSVKDVTNTFIILDTGSTDDTINICREYCKRNNITLFLKEDEFVNFEYSRNVLLDYADEVLDKNNPKYLLQLDCNDELQNVNELVYFVENYRGPHTGFFIQQKWWTGHSVDTYMNIRLVTSHAGWRYKGVVHEYMWKDNKMVKNQELVKGYDTTNDVTTVKGITLYQDRTKDDDKSMRRFKRDKELLYTEYINGTSLSRTLFYLAQTCGCLQLHQEAYQYYLLRTKETGFLEEIFHAYNRNAEMSRIMSHPFEETFFWCMKAFAHSRRVEPLLTIAEYFTYNNLKNEQKPDWNLAYLFSKMATTLIFPYNQILFVNKQMYHYKRWHLSGVISYYVGRYKEGKQSALKAVMAEDKQMDIENLVYYLRKDCLQREINTCYKIETFNEELNEPIEIVKDDKLVKGEIIDKIENKSKKYEELINKNDKNANDYLLLGLLAQCLKHPFEESLIWWLYSFGENQNIDSLLYISKYYLKNNIKGESKPDYMMSYMFSKAATLLRSIKNLNEEDERKYNYERYIVCAEAGFNIGRYYEAKCMIDNLKEKDVKGLKVLEQNKNENMLSLYTKSVKKMNDLTKPFSQIIHPDLIALSLPTGEMYREEDINSDNKLDEKEAMRKGLVQLLNK